VLSSAADNIWFEAYYFTFDFGRETILRQLAVLPHDA